MAVIKKPTAEEFVDSMLINFCGWRVKMAKENPGMDMDFLAERKLFIEKLRRLIGEEQP